MKKAGLAFAFIALMIGVGYMQFIYDSHYSYFALHKTFVTLPPGKTMKILSFGFHNLMADMLFIWSIQFYSTYNLTNRFDYLEHIFNTITDVNPRYKEPYIVGSWIMALEARDIRMAMRLLEKGAKNNPEEWIFDYELGFYAFKNLRNYPLAEKYFKESASKPNAPSMLERRWAHMVYMRDNLQYAYELWLDIYKKSKKLLERDSAANHLHQIKFEIDKKWLDRQIAMFKTKRYRFPFNLEELVRTGYIDKVPRDFNGYDYIYDAKTGKITASKVFRWKK